MPPRRQAKAYPAEGLRWCSQLLELEIQMRRTTVELAKQEYGGDSSSAPMKAKLWALGSEQSAESTPNVPGKAAVRTLCKEPRLSTEDRLAACNSGELQLGEERKITVPPFIIPCEWQFASAPGEAGSLAQTCAAQSGAQAGATTKARSVTRLAILASQTPVRDGAIFLMRYFLRYAAACFTSTWLFAESCTRDWFVSHRNRASLSQSPLCRRRTDKRK